MDIERAKELLSALADGVDPFTGEVLDRDNVCNRPEIIRALHTAVRAMEMRYIPEDSDRPRNASKSWSRSEDEKLCRMFETAGVRGKYATHWGARPRVSPRGS